VFARSPRRTALAVLLAAAAIGGIAALPQASSPARATRPAGATAFLAGVIRLIAANHYAQAWQTLDPTDQRIAPEDAYVACESQTPIPGTLVSLRTLRVRPERIGIAATFALRISGAALPEGVRVVLTAHAVDADGRWAWILPRSRRALYRSGCGYRPAPSA
jgi:hypothetical protein